MKYVLTYEAAPEHREKIPALIAEHRALWARFRSAGTLLLIGPFTEQPEGGAMGVFATRDAANEFVRDDPFVREGVVSRWRIREWNEVLMP